MKIDTPCPVCQGTGRYLPRDRVPILSRNCMEVVNAWRCFVCGGTGAVREDQGE